MAIEVPPTFSASPSELEERGKALRDRVPREAHAQWSPKHSRENPIDILRRSDENRLQELVPIRYGRMLPSPFTFFRGSAAVMAADLAETPNTGVRVQSCGDCHLKNFGGFATPERNICFDINDFDETLPAPWEWDLKRLATSFVLATRSNDLDKDFQRESALTCVRAYRKAMRAFAKLNPLDLWYERLDVDEFLAQFEDSDLRDRARARIKKATARRGADIDYPKLAEVVNGEVRIKDAPPLIFHPEVAHSKEFKSAAEDVLKRYRESLPDERRLLFDRYRYVDAAIKVVGVGSVGTRCWIVLMMSPDDDPLFLQMKQASASVLEPYAGKSIYSNHGQRVVTGQRLMQSASDIFLGWTTAPAGDFYIRQLRDAKISPLVETFDEATFEVFAATCGRNLARAHAKSGNAWTIRGYLGKGDAFDEAIATFSQRYADQAEADHKVLKEAVQSGKVAVFQEA